MATAGAPKQWSLTKTETLTSFESWKANLLYRLSLDTRFLPFLERDTHWGKESKSADSNRGFSDETITDVSGQVVVSKSGITKAAELRLFLGQIANFAPVISRGTIVKSCQSLTEVWQELRTYYGFQTTGANFLNFSSIKLGPNESPEELFQRMLSFVEDCMLTTTCGIKHLGQRIVEDEDMTPTLHNFIVMSWLEKINKDLPTLVKQKYATTLKDQTIASIKNEISLSMSALLDELQTTAEIKVMRIGSKEWKSKPPQREPWENTSYRPIKSKSFTFEPTFCKLCQLEKRSSDHRLSKCPYLPKGNKEYFYNLEKRPKIRQVTTDEPELTLVDSEEEDSGESQVDSKIYRVSRKPSPSILVSHKNTTQIPVILDTGAESTLIREDTANASGMPIMKTQQIAFQADGSTPLKVVGETKTTVHHANQELDLDGLIVSDLDVSILGGTPFIEINDISIRPAKHEIKIGDVHTCPDYQSPCSDLHGNPGQVSFHSKLRTSEIPIIHRATVKTPAKTTLWPGDHIDINVPQLPSGYDYEVSLAFEPSYVQILPDSKTWPPANIIVCRSGTLPVRNDTGFPITLPRNVQLGSVTSTYDPQPHLQTEHDSSTAATVFTPPPPGDNTDLIRVDPDKIIPHEYARKFAEINSRHSSVFNSDLPGYNGAAGDIKAVVNMGPTLPPQRKGRLPQYQPKRLQELQDKFDQLEARGIFVKPYEVGVNCEYVNPSFLVNSPGKSDSRLVTAFTDVGQYAKPQPSLMDNTEDTLRVIGKWKYVIKTDLSKAFFQIPLDKGSMKYCGVVTPFRGIRLYARAAMGMPGSETTLEELMRAVLGDFLYAGCVAKVADDLFCGADSLDELVITWDKVLQALEKCSLRLSATKTIICPKTTVILGWVWTNGHLSASKHRVSALATCAPPPTVKTTRGFIGAYKILSRVIKNAGIVLAPFEELCAGRASQDKIEWTPDLLSRFETAQNLLKSPATIVIPRPSDTLWIVTDGATSHGIGATLYALRKGRLLCGGFFSAKLKTSKAKHSKPWLPCEIEALGIASSIRHFAPFIVQADNTCHVLTDSKPCVQAYQRLQRGYFSNSPRLGTLLSEASHRQVTISHISGAVNLPSDYASRNAPPCESTDCQICTFVNELQETPVMHVTVQDILDGNAKLPFTSRPGWISTQQSDPDTRRAVAQLQLGKDAPKKNTKIRDVKRYLQVSSRTSDNLLIVRKTDPLSDERDLIVVPRTSVAGLLTAIHIRLGHPSRHQLRQIFSRFFYALDLDQYTKQVTESCHACASLKSLPDSIMTQSSSPAPTVVGTNFAADVMKLPRQSVLILRETVSSYTVACPVEDEKEDTLYSGLVFLCSRIRPIDGPPATIRTDPAPGFVAISRKQTTKHLNISLEIGSPKNLNKNPVAEGSIAELRREIRRQFPEYGALTLDQLEVVCQRLNSRIRNRGLSSYEMLNHRDQFTNKSIDVDDDQLIHSQVLNRAKNHQYSEKSKLKTGKRFPKCNIKTGDIVYLYSDKNKLSARPRYIVVSVDELSCELRKIERQFRNTTYRIHLADCYKVPQYGDLTGTLDHYSDDEDPVDIDLSPRATDDLLHNSVTCFKNSENSVEGSDNVESLPIVTENRETDVTNFEIGPNYVSPPLDLTRSIDTDTDTNQPEVRPTSKSKKSVITSQSGLSDSNPNVTRDNPNLQSGRSKRKKIPNVTLKDYILY